MTYVRPSAWLVAGCALASLASAQTRKPPQNPVPPEGSCAPGNTASLCIPLDSTFSIVTMDGSLGGNGPANPGDPCQRNDDDTADGRPLQFTFDLFGTPQTTVFINNNGNISFGSGFSTFTSTGFPVLGFPMVAPFWADVDTRGGAPSGTVWMRSELHRFTVVWDHVGYYNLHNNLLDTFEVIITDGTDPLVGIGNNVCFCYGDMQWTTGDASLGTGGFGGVPATVGANKGDGIGFFQVGLFDHPGTDYDGPNGNNDGVDFLDNHRSCFNVGNATNTPPIFVNPPQGCIMGTSGVPLTFTIAAIAPEAAQSTTMTVDAHGLPGFSAVITPGGPGGQATAVCTFNSSGSQTGTFPIDFQACDDFNPPACSDLHVCITLAECHQLVGRGGDGSQIIIFGHLYDTQLTSVRMHWPVTMINHPNLRVPQITSGQLNFSMQTLMYNPTIFPNNPDQWSQRLRLTILPGSIVQGDLFGTLNGIHQGLSTFTGPTGELYMTFPFTIDGM